MQTQLRGQFPLARVRIVEHVIPDQFHQKYSFQVRFAVLLQVNAVLLDD